MRINKKNGESITFFFITNGKKKVVDRKKKEEKLCVPNIQIPMAKVKLRKHDNIPKVIEKTAEEIRIERIKNFTLTLFRFITIWSFLFVLFPEFISTLFIAGYVTRILPGLFYGPENWIVGVFRFYFPETTDLISQMKGFFTCCNIFKGCLFFSWIQFSGIFTWTFLVYLFDKYNERFLEEEIQ